MRVNLPEAVQTFDGFEPSIYNRNLIKIGDMRLDFYTLERRVFGQGAKRRAQTLRERTAFTRIDQSACRFVSGAKRRLRRYGRLPLIYNKFNHFILTISLFCDRIAERSKYVGVAQLVRALA